MKLRVMIVLNIKRLYGSDFKFLIDVVVEVNLKTSDTNWVESLICGAEVN